jgi:hypothetical protein
MKDSIDPFDDLITRTERGDPPFVVFVGAALLVLGVVVLFATFQMWSYGECINVGHDENYCNARAVGCVR